MPIPHFAGDTFVAYTDISGFKKMMKDEALAARTLDRMYQAGYDILRNQPRHGARIEGIFVSDCGVLFARPNGVDEQGQLTALLAAIQRLNRALLLHDVMLTTSIAFGRFSYHERLEFEGIEKNPVYGSAYVAAYLDNESGAPRLQPGQCRILKHGLPPHMHSLHEQQDAFSRVRPTRDYFYFYWMVDDGQEIAGFQAKYEEASDRKYARILRVLKEGQFEA